MSIEDHIRQSGQPPAESKFARYRKRVKVGAWYASVGVPYDALLKMIERGILSEADAYSAIKRGRAVEVILEEWAKQATR